MNAKKKSSAILLLLISVLLIGFVVLTGCKKTEPAGQSESETAVSSEIQQTTCSVMGNAINKDVFTKYEGKKVYFCCAMCIDKFKENPEKYAAKLPQFNK